MGAGEGRGEVGWHNQTRVLPWQGSLTRLPDDRIEIRFCSQQHRGKKDRSGPRK